MDVRIRPRELGHEPDHLGLGLEVADLVEHPIGCSAAISARSDIASDRDRSWTFAYALESSAMSPTTSGSDSRSPISSSIRSDARPPSALGPTLRVTATGHGRSHTPSRARP